MRAHQDQSFTIKVIVGDGPPEKAKNFGTGHQTGPG